MTGSRLRAAARVLGPILCAIALLALFFTRGRPRVAELPPASSAIVTSAPLREQEHAPIAPSPSVPIAPIAPPSDDAPSLAALQRSLADYLAVSAYPPWSRAHDEGTTGKLAWNEPIVSDLPLDRTPGHETIYRFGADKAHVPFGEALTSWIEVLDADSVARGRPERVAPVIEAAWVFSVSGPSQGRTLALAYNDEGRDGDAVAGDRRYTNRFVPSEVPELAARAQHVFIQATVGAGSAPPRPILRDFTYAPRDDIAILAVREARRDGMLALTLDVDVHADGIYTFEANALGGADGATPIAYLEASRTLTRGKQNVEVSFFGRAFHEKKIDGPYVVKDIRVFHRFVEGEEESFFAVYPPPLVTRAYAWRDFAGGEWEAPEKDETVASFARLIEQTRKGEIGRPLASAPGQTGVHPSSPIR